MLFSSLVGVYMDMGALIATYVLTHATYSSTAPTSSWLWLVNNNLNPPKLVWRH